MSFSKKALRLDRFWGAVVTVAVCAIAVGAGANADTGLAASRPNPPKGLVTTGGNTFPMNRIQFCKAPPGEIACHDIVIYGTRHVSRTEAGGLVRLHVRGRAKSVRAFYPNCSKATFSLTPRARSSRRTWQFHASRAGRKCRLLGVLVRYSSSSRYPGYVAVFGFKLDVA